MLYHNFQSLFINSHFTQHYLLQLPFNKCKTNWINKFIWYKREKHRLDEEVCTFNEEMWAITYFIHFFLIETHIFRFFLLWHIGMGEIDGGDRHARHFQEMKWEFRIKRRNFSCSLWSLDRGRLSCIRTSDHEKLKLCWTFFFKFYFKNFINSSPNH